MVPHRRGRIASRSSTIGPLLLVLGACLRHSEPAPEPAPAPQEQPRGGDAGVVAWVDRHLVPLQGTDPAASLTELRALDSFVRDRRVIALGEATHGTREFFRLKHRWFRWLAEHHGFTVLAVELPFAAGVRLDEYIQGGEGDARTLLQGSYWFVDSQEFLELVAWMRAYNQSADPSARLELVGFDVQRPRESARALAAILAAAWPAAAARHREVLAKLAEADPGTGEAVVGLMEDMEHLSQSLEGELKERPRERARARGHLDVLLQDLDIRRHCGDAFGCQVVKRDLFMAQNVLRSLAGPASDGSPKKAVVWAHNGHVGRAPHPDGWWPMGSHLAAELGNALYVVGFAFDRGGFVAPAGGVGQSGRTRALAHLGGFEVAEYRVGPSPAGSVEHMLARASAPLYFLPLGDVAAAPEVAAWFREHREHNEYGAFAPSQARHTAEQLPLPQSFDALVFVTETHGYGFVEPGER